MNSFSFGIVTFSLMSFDRRPFGGTVKGAPDSGKPAVGQEALQKSGCPHSHLRSSFCICSPLRRSKQIYIMTASLDPRNTGQYQIRPKPLSSESDLGGELLEV